MQQRSPDQPYPYYPHHQFPSPTPPPTHPFASAPPFHSYPHNPDPTFYPPPPPNPYPSYDAYGGGYSDPNPATYETDGVYAYDGGREEPYGARGTKAEWAGFDDYGRAKGWREEERGGGGGEVVRAVPKEEGEVDGRSSVQKFRVKLLAETVGQTTVDVLCQIGLDGIRLLDASTSRTLRIYPLDTVMTCEIIGSSIFAFWSKTSVDFEQKRIRLESNSYMANIILDTVTAAKFQFNEMGGRDGVERNKGLSESSKQSEQPEKKKNIVDWMNILKPVAEEKDHWVPDEVTSKCSSCGVDFGAFVRKHHCRNCGDIFCDKCTCGRTALTADERAPVVRVCDRCLGEVTERLSRANESVSKSAGVYSHEDLARKLQEEMKKNCKSSLVSSSGGSGGRMREVACPICTVHLQVQLPSSGSKTVECGVCQHPFLVSAH